MPPPPICKPQSAPPSSQKAFSDSHVTTTANALAWTHFRKERMAAAASTARGAAKLETGLCTQTHPTATLTCTPNDKRLALAPSTHRRPAERRGRPAHRDERNSTAEQGQLRKQLGHQGEAAAKTVQGARSPLEKVRGAAAAMSRGGGLSPTGRGLVTGLTRSFILHRPPRESAEETARKLTQLQRADFKKKQKPQFHRIKNHCDVFFFGPFLQNSQFL